MIFFLLIPLSLFFRLMTEISLFNVMDTVSEESEDEIVRYICNENKIQSQTASSLSFWGETSQRAKNASERARIGGLTTRFSARPSR